MVTSYMRSVPPHTNASPQISLVAEIIAVPTLAAAKVALTVPQPCPGTQPDIWGATSTGPSG